MHYSGYARRISYRGIRMWSQKEAEFAQWFEDCGHDDWIYEPKVPPPEENYVPDFYLPKLKLRLFIEIKPTEYNIHHSSPKWEEFCIRRNVGILLLCGTPHYKSSWLSYPSSLLPDDASARSPIMPGPITAYDGHPISIEQSGLEHGIFTYYKDVGQHVGDLLKSRNADEAAAAISKMEAQINFRPPWCECSDSNGSKDWIKTWAMRAI